MLKKYYQQQLQILKDLGYEFSQAHPAVAPLLSGSSNDPDVERLLQGVAFLTGLIREKLDDDFPEIIHSLMDIAFPHYLRPIPSLTVVSFSPKPGLMETIQIPAGVSLTSVPVQGTECVFQTCFPTEIHPLKILEADLDQQPGKLPRVRLTLQLNGLDLSQWQPNNLRFFVGENFNQGALLFMLLTYYLKQIELRPLEGGSSCNLPSSALKPIGLDQDNALFPYPTQTFRGFRILQEYFALPQKFFFFELHGWDRWQNRGTGSKFAVHFELNATDIPYLRLNARQFSLFATPVVNLFAHDAEPVINDSRAEKIRISPSRGNQNHLQIFSVDKVVGIRRGSLAKREYSPLELFSLNEQKDSVYQLVHAQSPIDDAPELFLSLPLPPSPDGLAPETLSMSLTCTNGTLPERLGIGDIRQPTFETPELVTFANIMASTAIVNPPLGKNALWKFLSHMAMNFSQVLDRQALQALLKLYAYPEGRDKVKIAANLKRIEGILSLEARPLDRMIRGAVIRGQRVSMLAGQDHFANLGDLYLFASVIDLFLGVYSPMNSFVQFELKEELSGVTFRWPPRIGGVQLS